MQNLNSISAAHKLQNQAWKLQVSKYKFTADRKAQAEIKLRKEFHDHFLALKLEQAKAKNQRAGHHQQQYFNLMGEVVPV